jgi:hypothetical protein
MFPVWELEAGCQCGRRGACFPPPPPPCNQPIPLLNTNFSTNIVAKVFGNSLLQLDVFKTLLESPPFSPRPACHTSSALVAAELFAQGSSNLCFGSPNAFKHSHQRQNDMTGFRYVSRLQETVAQGQFICAPGNSRGNLNTTHQTWCSVCCVTFLWQWPWTYSLPFRWR